MKKQTKSNPQPTSKVAEPKKRTNRVPWKVKFMLAVIAAVGAYTIIYVTLATINNFFENNRFVFRPLIEVKFNQPIAIEPREAIELISPLASESAQPTEEATPSGSIIEEVKAAEPVEKVLRGEASYYSEAGCLGCSPTLTMANGERLDDDQYTVALTPETVKQHKLLNDMVRIYNPTTDRTVIAKVTDTGGFAKYNRIADLSVATKEALSCADICEIEIYFE